MTFTYEYEGQTLTYTVLDEEAKTCQVASVSGMLTLRENLVIPQIAKDVDTEYTVTSIGEYVFSGCSSLISVTILESVISIENSCFAGCGLTEIILPESLKTIGDECFKECPLTAVKFGPNIERIGSNAFSTLSQFNGGENLSYLGDKALGDNLRL
jgi:probable cell surface protein (leucine-rich repeat protein)